MNVNMITCGGQATIPMVAAVSRAATVSYAEIVASVSSVSAGPGTRANIDEFTRTTASGVETIGGAARGKAIIILNPAEPPMIMRDTIFCAVPPDADTDAIVQSVFAMEKAVQEYVPGYRLLQEPQIDEPSAATQGQTKVSIFVEVEGAGDYLPPYSGNLDIMTAAAAQVGENIAIGLDGMSSDTRDTTSTHSSAPGPAPTATSRGASSTSGSPTPACGTGRTTSGTSSPGRRSTTSSRRSTARASRSSR